MNFVNLFKLVYLLQLTIRISDLILKIYFYKVSFSR